MDITTSVHNEVSASVPATIYNTPQPPEPSWIDIIMTFVSNLF